MASNVAKISALVGISRELRVSCGRCCHTHEMLDIAMDRLKTLKLSLRCFSSKKQNVQQGRLGFVEGDFLRIVPMVNHHQITTILGDVFLKTSSKHFLPADPRKLPGWKTSDSVTHIFQAKIWLEVSIRLFFPGYLKKMLLKLSLKQIQDGLVKNPPTVRFLVVRETQNGETRFFF